MKLLALKCEVSITNKMLHTTINPRLRRSDVMINCIHSCIANTPEEFSRTPEVPLHKVLSQPRMFLHKSKRRNSLKQLKSFADTHSRRQLNKQMDMVCSDIKLVDFTSIFSCNLFDESLTINSKPVKLKGIHRIFNFPHKVEGILSEAMAKAFQIHFLTPQTFIRNKVPTMFVNIYFKEGIIYPSFFMNSKELNFMEADGSPHSAYKAEVSEPQDM